MTKHPHSKTSQFSKRKRAFFSRKYIPHERRKSMILACLFFWSIISYLLIQHWFMGSVRVQGDSMYPTLDEGERFMMHRWIYRLRTPERGEIAVIRDPIDETLSIKRVIGLPGDEIRILDGSVFVNNTAIQEPYLVPSTVTRGYNLTDHTFEVNEGHYFVLGDNREESEDSRFFGAIPRKDMVGLVPFKPKK